MVEPTITTNLNEAVAYYAFDDSTGYTFNGSYVEFTGSKIQLKDLGGFYNSGENYVITPAIVPSQVKKWIRTTWIDNAPTNTSVRIEVQFTDDGGSHWGINAPDYNDKNWAPYSKIVFDLINLQETGNEGVRFRITLFTDGSETPDIEDIELTYYTYSDVPSAEADDYTPVFTTKAKVSEYSINTVPISKITTRVMKAAETWMKIQFRKLGIDYTEMLSDDIFVAMLETIANQRVLCETGQFGVGTGVAGPISSISAGGITKSFSSVSGIQKGAEGSPLDMCEMAWVNFLDLIQVWRQGDGSAKKIMQGYARDNELIDTEASATGVDHRRRYYG